jgi:hypothetical protein
MAFDIFKSILVFTILAPIVPQPVHAQSIPTGDTIAEGRGHKSNISLGGVTVKSKKLSTADIIDSVIAHSKSNYFFPPAFRLKLDISLHDAPDTFFSSTTDAYLIKPLEKMKRYLLIVPSDSAYHVRVNRLSRHQSSRMMPVDAFPEQPLNDFLEDQKTQIANNESCYAFNATDSQFSILIRHAHPPQSLFARKNLDLPSSKTISFDILKVNRSDWALVSSYSSEMEVSKEEYVNFFSMHQLRAVVRFHSSAAPQASCKPLFFQNRLL